MKKLVIIVAIAIIGGYVVIQQNGLKLMKMFSDDGGPVRTVAQTTTKTTQSGPTKYKDGTYTGNASDAFYGNIKVQVIVSNGKITDVNFLEYPNDRPRSIAINTLAIPNLKQEALSAQSANVDIVSGATDSSQAFIQSLASALNQAK